MNVLINDDFNNYEKYNLPKVSLLLTDIPYNIGKDAYASSPRWWKNGNVKNGRSEKAESKFFELDEGFNINNFLQFASNIIEENSAVIVFCSYEQQFEIISKMKENKFKHYIPLVFIKNNSSEVLKVNMRIVGACEYGLLIYKDKLPKFYNEHKMIKNWFIMNKVQKKKHPNEKPEDLIETFIKLFTKENEVICDCCAGSGVVLKVAKKLNRKAYGFEIDKKFYEIALKNIGEDYE